MKQRFFHLKERAQSLTELAISFTFLMLLLAGSVDLARAFFFYLTLADASQEGAVEVLAAMILYHQCMLMYRGPQISIGAPRPLYTGRKMQTG